MFLDSITDKANKVLLGTQAAKKKMEDNFSKLMRQRNELFLYGSRSSLMDERLVDFLTLLRIMLENGQTYYKRGTPSGWRMACLAIFSGHDS